MLNVDQCSLQMECLAVAVVQAHDAGDAARLATAVDELRGQLTLQAQARVAHADTIEAAREGCSDDLEIDDFPLVSEAKDGAWVSSWTWVPANVAEESKGK